MVSNDRVIGELRTGKDFEGTSRGLREVLFLHFPRGTEKNLRMSEYPVSDRAHPEYEFRASPPYQYFRP
jgi:hypothetical protein